MIILIGVCLGALGAHALKAHLDADRLESFHTGVRYQIYHGLGMLMLCALSHQFGLKLKWAVRLMFLGVLLFSGSIYLLSIRDMIGISSWAGVLGPITPIGGLSLITGWLLTLISAWKLR